MKKKQIKFEKGIHRINFPCLSTGDFQTQIRLIEGAYRLPKHSVIGYTYSFHKATKKYRAFASEHVFIEK